MKHLLTSSRLSRSHAKTWLGVGDTAHTPRWRGHIPVPLTPRGGGGDIGATGGGLITPRYPCLRHMTSACLSVCPSVSVCLWSANTALPLSRTRGPGRRRQRKQRLKEQCRVSCAAGRRVDRGRGTRDRFLVVNSSGATGGHVIHDRSMTRSGAAFSELLG